MVGVPVPQSGNVSRSGTTGAPASTAAWNIAGRNRGPQPVAPPHHVVPSGKTATERPAAQRGGDPATVAGSALGRDRSTKTVPAARGQPADHRPAADLALGDQPGRRDRQHREDVQPGDVVGDQQRAGAAAAGPRDRSADAERRERSARASALAGAARAAAAAHRQQRTDSGRRPAAAEPVTTSRAAPARHRDRAAPRAVAGRQCTSQPERGSHRRADGGHAVARRGSAAGSAG